MYPSSNRTETASKVATEVPSREMPLAAMSKAPASRGAAATRLARLSNACSRALDFDSLALGCLRAHAASRLSALRSAASAVSCASSRAARACGVGSAGYGGYGAVAAAGDVQAAGSGREFPAKGEVELGLWCVWD
jgi:hypothetical protein